MNKALTLLLLLPLCMSAQVPEEAQSFYNSALQILQPDSTRNTTIDIVINAKMLFPLDSVNYNYIVIRDNKSHPKDSTASGRNQIKEYVSNVFRHGKVKWRLSVDHESRREGFSAELTQIELNNGKSSCIFGTPKIPGNSPIIMAEVIGGSECESEPYKIKMLLHNRGGDVRLIEFDPILKGNN